MLEILEAVFAAVTGGIHLVEDILAEEKEEVRIIQEEKAHQEVTNHPAPVHQMGRDSMTGQVVKALMATAEAVPAEGEVIVLAESLDK